MAKFDLKGMLSERSTQEIDLPEQKTVYRNPEDLMANNGGADRKESLHSIKSNQMSQTDKKALYSC